MKETRADLSLHPSRIRIEIDGECVAMGSIENPAVWHGSLIHPGSIVFAHPNSIDAVRRIAVDAAAHQRRLN